MVMDGNLVGFLSVKRKGIVILFSESSGMGYQPYGVAELYG